MNRLLRDEKEKTPEEKKLEEEIDTFRNELFKTLVKPNSEDGKDYELRDRQFLNRLGQHGNAFAAYSIDADVEYTDDYIDVDAEFVIADCSRTVTLDFNFGHKEKTEENALRKLDILYTMLGEFREELIKLAEANKQVREGVKRLKSKPAE